MGVTEIFSLIAFIGLGLTMICGFIFNKTNKNLFGYLTCLFLVIFFVFVLSALIRDRLLKPVKELYQEKVKAVEDAEKDLEKFLIDHPEFREVKDD